MWISRWLIYWLEQPEEQVAVVSGGHNEGGGTVAVSGGGNFVSTFHCLEPIT